MSQSEIMTRTDRRRLCSPSGREAIMREADAPGVTVREVAKRHDTADSLIYSWLTTRRRQAEKIANEPLRVAADCSNETVRSRPVADICSCRYDPTSSETREWNGA